MMPPLLRPMSRQGQAFEQKVRAEIGERIKELARLGSPGDLDQLDRAAKEISRKVALLFGHYSWWASRAAYQRSPEWQAKRQQKLRNVARKQRRGYRMPLCERCGDREATTVHHVSYDHCGPGRWGKEPLSDLEALCGACHDQHHGED